MSEPDFPFLEAVANQEIRSITADDRLPDVVKEELIRIVVDVDTRWMRIPLPWFAED